jgi:gluconolactonase
MRGPSRSGLRLGLLEDTRYLDPRIEVLDKRFRYKQGKAGIERIATGFRWAERPGLFPRRRLPDLE